MSSTRCTHSVSGGHWNRCLLWFNKLPGVPWKCKSAPQGFEPTNTFYSHTVYDHCSMLPWNGYKVYRHRCLSRPQENILTCSHWNYHGKWCLIVFHGIHSSQSKCCEPKFAVMVEIIMTFQFHVHACSWPENRHPCTSVCPMSRRHPTEAWDPVVCSLLHLQTSLRWI